MQAEFARIRRQVSFEQVVELLKLVKEYPQLYRSSLMPSLVLAQEGFWDKCAETLNSMQGGAFKDAYGWSQYWRYFKYRIKQRTIEITSNTTRSKVPEDDCVPLVLVDNIILYLLQSRVDQDFEDGDDRPNLNILDINDEKKKAVKEGAKPSTSKNIAVDTSSDKSVRKRRYSATDGDRAKLAPLEIRLRYLGERSNDSVSDNTRDPSYRKRRQAFANASNAIEHYFKRSPKKSPKKIKDGMMLVAASICRRRHTFTNMNVATEQYRQNRALEQIRDLNKLRKQNAEEIELRKQEEIENMNLIHDTLLRLAIVSIRMVAIRNTAEEILSNNPGLQHTMSSWPTIF